jgi:hypothetical protein
MIGPRARTLIAVSLCALLLGAPAPASARVTVNVQIAFGAVVAGGVGFFVSIGGSGELPFAPRSLPTAVLEVSDGRASLGVPLPSLELVPDPADDGNPPARVQVNLVRWRF